MEYVSVKMLFDRQGSYLVIHNITTGANDSFRDDPMLSMEDQLQNMAQIYGLKFMFSDNGSHYFSKEA